MSTPSTTTRQAADEQIVAATWEAAKAYVVDPAADDAPAADRLKAIELAVQTARDQRARYGTLPARLAAFVETFDEAVRRARPATSIQPPRAPAPVFVARILTALSSTPAQVARMTPAQVAAADAVCLNTPHDDLLRALTVAVEDFTEALEAEIATVPRGDRETIARRVDPRRIAAETAALRDEPLVPAADRNDVRLATGSPA